MEDISRLTDLENHIDDLALEEIINDLEEQAREYSKVAITTPVSNKKELESIAATYRQIAKWLRELQKYRKMYPQDRISDEYAQHLFDDWVAYAEKCLKEHNWRFLGFTTWLGVIKQLSDYQIAEVLKLISYAGNEVN